MNVGKSRFDGPVVWVLAAVLGSCTQGGGTAEPQPAEPTISNRLEVPPAVVNNLGITFATASRGRLGTWRTVPGQLEVPENRRWLLRSPVRARLLSVAPRWHAVEPGSELATLVAPDLREAQRAIELAQRTLERAIADLAAAGDRLTESEAQVQRAMAFELASQDRLRQLLALDQQGNGLTAGEIIEARRNVTEAGRARLDAAIVRDELVSRVAALRIEADQSSLVVGEKLSALALMTGQSVEDLAAGDGQSATWRRLDALVVRAPAKGIVVELLAAQAETLEAGAPILQVFDPAELRFRGHLPEGDLGLLSAGARVRLEFPSRRLQPLEIRLEALLPVADTQTRMVRVEAVVPNPDGVLAHGISAIAHVLVSESQSEEVLLPARCVVLDGLESIVFRRDPKAPQVVIRTPVELGARATHRVEVLAGLLDGDQVVADGVHQLKQTGFGKAPEGGHFHADGTWHKAHK